MTESLFDLLLTLYTPEDAMKWLTMPNKMLDGHSRNISSARDDTTKC